MSQYALKFDTGDGESVQLNSVQLLALLNVAQHPTIVAYGTYYALLRRRLIEPSTNYLPRTLTPRGAAVIEAYRNQRNGRQT